jgi:hypothetical protein
MKIHHFNAIISDNRYGLYHPGVKSIFITHQLAIRTGAGRGADFILKQIHDHFIKQFTACWIPDVFSLPNLSGKLGHPAHLPSNSSYLGPISRMIPMETAGKLDLLVILSGPEPQRTLLENILMVQLQKFSGTYLLVRGLPGEEPTQNPQILPYLDALALNRKLAEASLVICRSGYSGIMDLVKLKKKAILIPTPGQTEQEYLAIYLEKHYMFLRAEQKGFNLLESIQRASSFPFNLPDFDFNEYKTVLSRFIQSL